MTPRCTATKKPNKRETDEREHQYSSNSQANHPERRPTCDLDPLGHSPNSTARGTARHRAMLEPTLLLLGPGPELGDALASSTVCPWPVRTMSGSDGHAYAYTPTPVHTLSRGLLRCRGAVSPSSVSPLSKLLTSILHGPCFMRCSYHCIEIFG